MSKPWPMVPLGEVLTERREVPSLEAVTMGEIRIVSKIGFNDGQIQLREDGKTRTGMILIRPGDLVVSGINAAKGAIAIYDRENSETIAATIHYGAYTPNKTRVDTKFLWWLLRSRTFRDLLLEFVPGGIKTELKAKRLLPIPIPLPPLSEQRRIVGRIGELADKVEEAQSLRQQAADEVKRLLICMAHRQDIDEATKSREGWRRLPLSKCVQLVDDSHRVEAVKSYPNLGIYSFGRGLFQKPPIDGALTSANRLRRVKRGQFIYSRLFAFEGACGMVSDEFDGYFVSGEYPTFDCNSDVVRVEFLASYFKLSAVWRDISAGSKGLGDRRQRVQPKEILDYSLWVPPLPWQNLIAEMQTKMDVLKNQQEKTRVELGALLSSILDRAFKGRL